LRLTLDMNGSWWCVAAPFTGQGSRAAKPERQTSVDRTAFPLSNETEVEECHKENGIDNGAHAADFRRLDEARPQERHRNTGQVEIEKYPCAYEEGACKELAHVLPRNLLEHVQLLS
jgi:hypothetical protein